MLPGLDRLAKEQRETYVTSHLNHRHPIPNLVRGYLSWPGPYRRRDSGGVKLRLPVPSLMRDRLGHKKSGSILLSTEGQRKSLVSKRRYYASLSTLHIGKINRHVEN